MTVSNTQDDSRVAFDFGQLGRFPVTDDWGFSRGRAVDRRYVQEFLRAHSNDIRGHVVEVGDRGYTQRFGGDQVARTDVLDVDEGNRAATIVADLSAAPHVPSNTFDCIILTQVLVLIRRAPDALREIRRILRPGGVALITVPGISQISSVPQEADAWSWTFYPNTLKWLLAEAGFDERFLSVQARGNFRTTIAFLAGLAQEDLKESDFDFDDSRYPLIVTARAVKSEPLP